MPRTGPVATPAEPTRLGRPRRAPRQWRETLGRIADLSPVGVAPPVLLLLAVVSGGLLLRHPVEENPASLTMWTFAKVHQIAYAGSSPQWDAAHPGQELDIRLVHGTAINQRLRSAFWSDADVPDLVEVEITQAGSFFRGPESTIGFRDLKPWLVESGLWDRMVRTRFAPYTDEGRVYGIPHDVHPVMLAYRTDLFEELGIDPESIHTWDDFAEVGRRITNTDPRAGDLRYLVSFSSTNSDDFEVLLFQRGGGLFDAEGNVTLDSDVALRTMLWFVPQVAGEHKIAADAGNASTLSDNLNNGYVLALLCPDWRSKVLEKDAPLMSGQMKLMPLPAWEEGGRRTSTRGGTMLGITKRSENVELAQAAAVHLYADEEQLAERFRETNILPPLKTSWDSPVFDEPRAYWSGQPIGRLYVELADDVPPQYTSAYTQLAKAKMGQAVTACKAYYEVNGERGFEIFARAELKAAADYVRGQMARNPF